MKIVYYSGATTGSGHIIQGLSIYNGLKRNGIVAEFTMVTSSEFPFLADQWAVPHIRIPSENEAALSKNNCRQSVLYNTIIRLDPDVLIVDLAWFALHYFIDDLECAKIILFRQLSPDGFMFPLLTPPLQFSPSQYDHVVATEPFRHEVQMAEINPIIIRNRDEILTKEEALDDLGLHSDSVCCLFSLNGKPGEFDEYKKMYAYLEDEGFTMVYSSNYDNGLFPAVDYFNAFELIITGGGYNSFWETRYFEKQAVHIPFPRRFESQQLRIAEHSDHSFSENGSDQLAVLIYNL